jgi:UDP-N-acetyl-D-mannosaminuronic acid transferase (WecB/TagA/CpsF family)
VRTPVDAVRIRQLMEALAGAADRELRIYMVGGTTAVLMDGGRRRSTSTS